MTPNFFPRLINEIKDSIKFNIKSPLEIAFHQSPIRFLGMILLFGSIFFMLLFIVIIGILTTYFPSFFGNNQLISNMIQFFGILAIIGMGAIMITTPRDRLLGRKMAINPISKNSVENSMKNKNIFVGHGQNSKIKDEVTGFLKSIDLIPIVLLDEPNLGKTIIEKVEHYVALTSFAIVILTKDDFGVSKIDFDIDDIRKIFDEEIDSTDLLRNARLDLGYLERADFPPFIEVTELSGELLKQIKPRARQNVIFELGITIGILDRKNVRVIYEDGVELPTDIRGFAYTSLDHKWKENIVKELKAAHIDCKV